MTPEARRSLRQDGTFPSSNAGLSVNYRVSGAENDFSLDKDRVDQAVMRNPKDPE